MEERNGVQGEEESLLNMYIDHLVRVILPFWQRAMDTVYGGVFTCYSNDGRRLISKDKYTWSQGRFLWLWSRIVRLLEEKILRADAQPYYEQANKTASFLLNHVFLENGNCAFLLTEKGEKKEAIPGRGLDTSIYADCFVLLGLTEYFRLVRSRSLIDTALQLHDRIQERIQSGYFKSDPYPVPEGYRAHAISMIMLHVTHELAEALLDVRHPRGTEILDRSLQWMDEIVREFLLDDGRIREFLPAREGKPETLLSRHVNPGHALECMWFVLTLAKRASKTEYLSRAVKAIKRAFQLGWDFEYGGLFRFVDPSGGKPQGVKRHEPYEQLILRTWATKLWWPHAEALYATLLGYTQTRDPALWAMYKRTEEYVFSTFPHPDPEMGEWIQIRDRRGRPLEQTVALPVKDPYHIMRSLLLIIELLSKKQDVGGRG